MIRLAPKPVVLYRSSSIPSVVVYQISLLGTSLPGSSSSALLPLCTMVISSKVSPLASRSSITAVRSFSLSFTATLKTTVSLRTERVSISSTHSSTSFGIYTPYSRLVVTSISTSPPSASTIYSPLSPISKTGSSSSALLPLCTMVISSKVSPLASRSSITAVRSFSLSFTATLKTTVSLRTERVSISSTHSSTSFGIYTPYSRLVVTSISTSPPSASTIYSPLSPISKTGSSSSAPSAAACSIVNSSSVSPASSRSSITAVRSASLSFTATLKTTVSLRTERVSTYSIQDSASSGI